MADAYFQFETNIELIQQRIVRSMERIQRALARETTQQGGGQSDAFIARMNRSVEEATRRLLDARNQFERSLQAGTGRPEGAGTFRSEAQRILAQTRTELLNDLRALGEAAGADPQRIRRASQMGAEQLTAGIVEIFQQARSSLRGAVQEAGLTARNILGSSGLDVGQQPGQPSLASLGIDVGRLRTRVPSSRAGFTQESDAEELRAAELAVRARREAISAVQAGTEESRRANARLHAAVDEEARAHEAAGRAAREKVVETRQDLQRAAGRFDDLSEERQRAVELGRELEQRLRNRELQQFSVPGMGQRIIDPRTQEVFQAVRGGGFTAGFRVDEPQAERVRDEYAAQALEEQRRAAIERNVRLEREEAEVHQQRLEALRRGLEQYREMQAQAELQRQQAFTDQFSRRVLTGEATRVGSQLYLDRSLGRFVQVVDGQARILQGTINTSTAAQLRSAIDRLRREAERASARVSELGGAAGGGGGQPPTGFGAGFLGGFSSRGFGGRGARGFAPDFMENLGATLGMEARFLLTYRALLLLQTGLRDTIDNAIELSEAERNLDLALGDTLAVTNDLGNELSDIASIAGERTSEAFNVAARGVRAFIDVGREAQAEVTEFAGDFAQSVERLSVIAQQSLAESANEAVAIGQSFNLRNQMGAGIIEEVVAEARRLGGDPDEISSGLANIGVAAVEAGLDVRETAAIISASIAQTAQSGQAVATRLSRVMNTLRGSTGATLLQGLGIDTAQSPIEQLRELADLYDRLSEQDQRMVASRLSGVTNIREFTVLLDSLRENSRVQQVVSEGYEEGGEAADEYARRLETLAGQVQLIVGQLRELQSGLAQAGVFDILGAGLALIRPFLQTINDLVDLFNLIPGPLRRIIVIGLEVAAATAVVQRIRASQAAAIAAETGQTDALAVAKRAEAVATANLVAHERALAAVHGQTTAAIATETQALNGLTAARARARTVGGAAIVPMPPPAFGTGVSTTGGVGALPPPPNRFTTGAGIRALPGAAAGFLRSNAGFFAITAGIIALQGLAGAVKSLGEAAEETEDALDAARAAQIDLSSEGTFASVDTLRAAAAAQREAASGFVGSIFNAIQTVFATSPNETADMLEQMADEQDRLARDRQTREQERASRGGGFFGLRLEGIEELAVGLAAMDSAGQDAATAIDEVLRALGAAVTLSVEPEADLEWSQQQVDDTRERLENAASLLRDTAVRAANDLAVAIEGGVVSIDRATGERRSASTTFDLSAETLAEQAIEHLPGIALSDADREALSQRAVSAFDAAVATAMEDGLLTTEDIPQIARDVAQQTLPTSDPAVVEEYAEVLEQFFRETMGLESTEVTRQLLDDARAALTERAGAIQEVLRLQGASELEAAQGLLRRQQELASFYERTGELVPPELLLAIEASIREVQDIQATLASARRQLRISALPEEDVIGRQRIERQDLQAQLAIARRRNNVEDTLNIQTQLNELEREIANARLEQINALAESQVDPRDTVGQARVALDNALRVLQDTEQFDSAGEQTQAYSEAYLAYVEAQQALADEQRALADAIDRSQVDPRDEVGQAAVDLRAAQRALAAALPNSIDYYEALADLAEAQLALAEAQSAEDVARFRAAFDVRDDIGQARADLFEAEEALRLALPETAEYFEALIALSEAQIALAEAISARDVARYRASIDPRDEIGNATADLFEAQEALRLALPNTAEYFEALRQLQEAQLALAQTAADIRAAQRLAGVRPGDEIGRLAAELANARDQLALALPNTAEYYNLIGQINQAEAALAAEHRAIADAALLAGVDPRDTIGQAAAQLEIAQRALAAAVPGSRDFYEAQRQVAEAQQALADEHRALADARDLAAVAGAGEIEQAEAQLRIAQRALEAALPGTIAYYEALAQVTEAEQALADARQAVAEARILAQVFPGSQIQQATAQLEIARQQLAEAEANSVEYWQALGAMQEAQVALAQAQVAARADRRLLSIDMTNPIEMARARLAELRDLLAQLQALGAPADVINGILVQIQEATNALQQTIFGERLSNLQALVDIGAISEEEYIAYLEAEKARLLAIQDRSYQQNQQLIQIQQALQAANEGLQGMFNLGDIRVPTPFEVRRAIATALPGLTEIEDAFGTGSNRDPVGILVAGSIEAVDNLSAHVEDFGNLVSSLLGQVGLALVDGQIVPASSAPQVTPGTGFTPIPMTNVVGQQGTQLPVMGGGTPMVWHQNVSVQIDGANFDQVRAYFDRLLGPQAGASRAVATTRKV